MKAHKRWLIIAALFGFASLVQVFNLGYTYAKRDMIEKTDVCVDKVIKQTYIGDFYKHEAPVKPVGYYNHAMAFTEMMWAKCIREEMRK